MTFKARLFGVMAVSGFAALAATAPANALSTTECSAKYQAAKKDGSLNGMKWNDFRKAQCGSDATPAAAPAASTTAAPAATPAATATKEAAPKEAAPAAKDAAPVDTGNAVFPTAIDPKFATEKPHMARMHTCSQQWQANKTAKTTGGMKWNQKGGGGFYSECNKRLKGSA